MTVEAALGVELDEHLGYPKNDPIEHNSVNSPNALAPSAPKTGLEWLISVFPAI
ncbi:hypothetical protein GCM10027180_13680 [Microbulbifer echini]